PLMQRKVERDMGKNISYSEPATGSEPPREGGRPSPAGPPPRDPDTSSRRHEREEGLPQRPAAGDRGPQVRGRVAGRRRGVPAGGGDRQDADPAAHRGGLGARRR